MQKILPILAILLVSLLAPLLVSAADNTVTNDPTAGWTLQPLKYSIQFPYNLTKGDRYTYDPSTDTHHFWVFNNDLAHATNNHTLPRTELRVEGVYTNGQHQFAADLMVPPGTSHVCLMQVFGGAEHGHATSLQLRVYDGKFTHYQDTTLRPEIYGQWFHLNVTHDVSTHVIQIFINGQLSLTTHDNGGKAWYFKCGVYGQEGMSHKMEVYYRNIKIYTR